MLDMADRDGVIWMDGKLIPWRDATVHVLTHSLHYGLGIFEGIRAYATPTGNGAIFRLPEHSQRFMESAKILNMPMPYSVEELNAATIAVVQANNLTNAYIRPLGFYGSQTLGLHAEHLQTRVIIAAWDWGAYLPKQLRMKTSSYSRHHVNVSMCRAKCTGHYVNSILALQEVTAVKDPEQQDKDGNYKNRYDEVLLLDTEGYVAEGSGENIFVIRGDQISTPDLASCLDGITRRTVITFLTEMGYSVRERRITRDEVYTCDEAFLTGTAAEIAGMTELDNRPIGSGLLGPITNKVREQYIATITGTQPQYASWLTHV